jgi:predicted nucleic acid-binding protein
METIKNTVGLQKASETKVTDNTVKTEEKKVILLADTSWLVALLDENDSHHIAAKSSLGAVQPYGPKFHVPILAAIETMSRLIRVNKMPVTGCKKKVLTLLGQTLHAQGADYHYKFEDILKRYEKWGRKKIKNLTANDFCIVTEGIGLGAKILTCDLKMYNSVKKYYPDIYFMSDKVEAQESDLARLIHDIQMLK